MQSVPVFVGLDYHSGSVQACVLAEDGRVILNRRLQSSVEAVIRAASGTGRVMRVAIEAGCGSSVFAEELVAETGWCVSLAHPGYVKRMKNNPDKTDYGDARMLADLCRVGYLPEVWLAPESIRDLRTMVRCRADLVQRRKEVKTQILAALRARRISEPEAGRWSQSWFDWLRGEVIPSTPCGWVLEERLLELDTLNERIRLVEKRLAEVTADDPVVAHLRTLPDVGLITACVLRAFIGRIDRFGSSKQLARFCGVTPRNASSGERVADAGLVKAGDPLLKTLVILMAHRLRRHSPRWIELDRRLAAEGKPACVIIGAIANRWVRWLYYRMMEFHHQQQAMEAGAVN